MTATRTTDAQLVNAIMSDAFGQPMDFADSVGNHGTFALVGDHGCMLFRESKPAIYSLVMGITEEGRGAWAKAFVEDALRFMFTQTDAKRLWSMTLRQNRHVIAMAAHATGISIEHNGTHSFASVSKEGWSAKHAVTNRGLGI